MKKLSCTILFLLTPFLFASLQTCAQGKLAVVIIRVDGENQCDGSTELRYETVLDLRLNQKTEVRLLTNLSDFVTRADYEAAVENKLIELTGISWANGRLVSVARAGRPSVYILPEDMKPQRNVNQPTTSFFDSMFTGEARDGKQKRKVAYPTRSVDTILFIPEGGNPNDALYSFADSRSSVTLWEAFLRKTNNYRQNESNTRMRRLLIACARESLDQFAQGSYGALEQARSRVERAENVLRDAESESLRGDIAEQRKRVNDTKEQVYSLIAADKFDEAIDAAETIKIYLSSWTDLNSKYGDALRRSHDLHLFNGRKSLEANQPDVALRECTLARKRVADSNDATACFCSAGDRLALRDAKVFMRSKQPGKSVDVLRKQLSEAACIDAEPLVAELTVSSCAYATELLNGARQITSRGAPPVASPRRSAPPHSSAALKTVTAQSKRDFLEARSKLILATQMCPRDELTSELDYVNRAISDYLVAEARKASIRNASGTAYVYLVNAQSYTPSSETVSVQLGAAREALERDTRVSVGTAFDDRSGSNYGRAMVDEIGNSIEQTATQVGLSTPSILSRDQASRALRTIQAQGQTGSPTIALFYGELSAAVVNVNTSDRVVRSSFTQENPVWKERDRQHDAADEQYKRCKKTDPSQQSCGGLAARVAELRAWRDSVEKYPRFFYDYYERHYAISGAARISLRYSDSVSRSTRIAETLVSTVTDQCVERRGVDPRDRSASNTDCSRSEIGNYVGRMTQDLAQQASGRAHGLLRELAPSYYARARSSANRVQSVEEYLRFLFLTSDKDGVEAQEAIKNVMSFDPDLRTDGVLR